MIMSFSDLSRKDVIRIKDGARLGAVGDLIIDTAGCRIVSLVIPGRRKLFGLLDKEEDIIISWDEINIIGEDAVLVNFDRRSDGRNRGCN
ncbi:MAG: YlmC/YmxH family sporulation protein [Oscillospiraceae bacterium]|jgi:YlmC/YmxH family sporulation protein|nr:YlmC/YmxH family sporulation protein [Oscillospiraceae bacterium]